MNIAKVSVTRPVAVTMRIAALVLLGWVCLQRLPVDLLPRVDIPTVAITVEWPNTSPNEMETQIARPLEQAVATVQGMDLVSSTSSLGRTFLRVQFKYGTDIDQAAIDVMQAVQRAKRRFPNDPTLLEPSVFKFDPSAAPILVYGVKSDTENVVQLRRRLIDEISPFVESAGGVATVEFTGGQDRAIMVEVDPEKLKALGLSISDVSRRLQQENLALPAGIAREGNTEYSIRSIGYFRSLEELRDVPLRSEDGRLVRLSQVASVRDASQEVRSIIRLNGEPAINMGVTKQADANTTETADGVKARIAELETRYPGIQFNLVYDQSHFISRSIHDLQETAVIGGVLAILIITFFLRNFRSTFVVALSIPISVISTFALLYFCGFTLNTISLSGLALAVGLIVDDAIVVLENIYRHIERDKKRAAEASVSGTQEILSAVFASTFTVMIVFLPLLLIKGQAGQTFTQFALVVVFSLAVSLLDAVTVVPMLASRMVKEQQVMEEAHPELRAARGHKPTPLSRLFDGFGHLFNAMDASYRRGLEWAIRRRVFVLAIGVGSVAAAYGLWPMIGKEQLPKTDSGDVSVRVRLPVGTALAQTDHAMRQITEILLADPAVETVITGSGANVGIFGARQAPSHEGAATVRLKEKEERGEKTQEVVERLQGKLAQVPGVRAMVSSFDLVSNIISGQQTGVAVEVYGQDFEELAKTAARVQEAMSEVAGLQNVDVEIQQSVPEVQWQVDRQKAQTLGISFQDIATTISASTNGLLSTYYQESGFQYPIYVQVPEAQRKRLSDLRQLPVVGTGAEGSPVLLGQVATAELGFGPNEITRNNRQRYISVGGRVQDRTDSEVQRDVKQVLEKVEFPEGSYWTFGTREMRRQAEFQGLGLAVVLAIALIYMLLASQFESFVYPLVVLTSVPLCAIGMVLALFLTDRAFGLTAFIGLLMLVGIVVKNGILLVDYTNQLRARGMRRDEALLTAAPTRLRPILMTTLAAILGMLPLAIGVGSGSEMYAPLATTVIGGLATSSLLTLFIVPTMYTLFDDLIRKTRGMPHDLTHPELVEPSVVAVEHQAEPGGRL